MQKITWPAVAMTLIAAAFLFGIFLVIPDDQPQMRSALLGLVLLGGQAVVGYVTTKGAHDVGERVTSLENKIDEGGGGGGGGS